LQKLSRPIQEIIPNWPKFPENSAEFHQNFKFI
jgi:hypothetical protein